MGYAAKVIADSVTEDLHRLTTIEVTMPRIVLAEFNTHRVFSRNSASSRAIPVEKRIAAVFADPFVPEAFGANKRGMQAGEALDSDAQGLAKDLWILAMRDAVGAASALAKLGVHKQWANRLIEPFSWHTVVVTATEWDNFFALRCNPEAQPEIRRAAEMMRDVMNASTPTFVEFGGWHLPYVDEDERARHPVTMCVRMSVARCARVSYLTHDGVRDVDADLALHDKLLASGHMSPFEHAARASATRDTGSNFAGWRQYRKMIPGEAVFVPGRRLP